MSSKYSTKQYISAQYCAKQMSEIWCKNIQAFLRHSNFHVGIFCFASPCRVMRHLYCAVVATKQVHLQRLPEAVAAERRVTQTVR